MASGQAFPRMMLFMLGASVVLVIAVTSLHGSSNLNDYEAYALSVGAVAGVLALIILILLYLQPSIMGKHLFSVRSTSVDVQYFLAAFLFVWWFFGASIITFKAPFTVTSNGYFAAWVGLFASAMALEDVGAFTASKVGRGATLSLCLAATIVLIAIAVLHDKEDERKSMGDESIFGLVTACFTIVCCLLMLCIPNKIPEVAFKVVAILLLLLWIAAAGVLTFREPFVITGNGYFGSWAGLIFSCMLFSEFVFSLNIQAPSTAQPQAANVPVTSVPK